MSTVTGQEPYIRASGIGMVVSSDRATGIKARDRMAAAGIKANQTAFCLQMRSDSCCVILLFTIFPFILDSLIRKCFLHADGFCDLI
jgi:hypothetical protein